MIDRTDMDHFTNKVLANDYIDNVIKTLLKLETITDILYRDTEDCNEMIKQISDMLEKLYIMNQCKFNLTDARIVLSAKAEQEK